MAKFGAASHSIPAEELWRTHERRRERLVAWARQRVATSESPRARRRRRSKPPAEVLDPDALTIGFARRFATYKRATLILRDVASPAAPSHRQRAPVQIIFAGKAHPADDAGKELIRQHHRCEP